MATEITQHQIEAVRAMVKNLTADRHLQLTLLTAVLVLFCREYNIMRSSLFDHIKELFGRPAEVKPTGTPLVLASKNDNASA